MVVLNTLATTFGRSFPVRRQCLIAYAIGVEVFKANYSDRLTMTALWRPNLAFAIRDERTVDNVRFFGPTA